MRKRLLALVLALFLLCAGAVSALGSYESHSLVSQSYLEGSYLQGLLDTLSQKLTSATGSPGAASMLRIKALAQYYLNKLGYSEDGINWTVSGSFVVQESLLGDAITLAPGSGLVWTSGSAQFSGLLLDVTDGVQLTSGALTEGHRYVAAETCVVTVDSSRAVWAAEGKWLTQLLDQTLTAISVSTLPNKTEYLVGTDALDVTGGVLTLHFASGATDQIDLTADMVSGFDNTVLGTQTLTVTYSDFTTTYDVTVTKAVPVSISVTAQPSRLSYYVGEELDTAGLVVTAAYSDGTSVPVTGYTLSGYSSASPGTRTVTVSYNSLTTTFTVTVTAVAAQSISPTTLPDKLVYSIGEALDATGLVVTAVYNNGTTAPVTGYTLSGYDEAVSGEQTVTIHYEGLTATFTVTVEPPPLPGSITSDVYTVSDGVIRAIPLGTTAAQLLENIHEKEYVQVMLNGSPVSGDTPMATGMTLVILDGETVHVSVTAVVTGDVNGDGKITITDMLSVKSHVLKNKTLTGAAAAAADTNGDGSISITDFVQLKSHILGKSAIEAK